MKDKVYRLILKFKQVVLKSSVVGVSIKKVMIRLVRDLLVLSSLFKPK